jgi:hypothetical protein
LCRLRHRPLVVVAGRIGQHRQFAGPAGRSAIGRHLSRNNENWR